MKPVPDRRFPCLNAVRAVAAIGVVATHTAFDTGEVNRGWHGAVLSRLDFGVTLFFVLSGFLLARPFFLARSRGLAHPSYLHFVWKRGLRILPLYWVTVVVALALVSGNEGANLARWARDLTLTQIYAPHLLSFGLTQMWSLCTEVAFYLLLPGLCWVLLRRTTASVWQPGRVLAVLGIISAAGVAWQAWAGSHSFDGQHLGQWLPGFMPWFCIGMAFALVSAEQRLRPRDRRVRVLERAGSDLVGCWLVAAAVFVIACTPVAGPRLLITPTALEAGAKCVLYGVAAAFLVLPLVFGPERDLRVRAVLASRVPTWLGDVSYGIFCLHLIALESVLDFLDVTVFTGRFQDVFLLTLLLTVAAAAVSYYAVERPFLRLKNVGRFSRTGNAPTASAATIST